MKLRHFFMLIPLWIPLASIAQHVPLSGREIISFSEKISQPVKSDTGFFMDFETVETFSLSFGSWKVRDLDSNQTFSISGHTFPHQGDPMAYICFNPEQVVPAMTDPAIRAHGGEKFGACFSAVTPPNNDWFISPKIQLKNGGGFSFWVKSYTNAYGFEKYKVAVSAGTNNPSDFTYISGSSPLSADTSWTRKSFSLSAFNDREVYVAIQCVSDTAFIFMIDDLEVYPGDTVESYPSSANQDFEQVADFSLDFTPWTVRDVNGGNTYGIENCFFPHNGEPMAWINFNPSAAAPPPLNMTAHSGNKFGACFSSIPPNNPNNKWLISPKLKLEDNAKISFWVSTYNLQYGYEKFKVGVSTGGTDPSDFEIISGNKPDSAGVSWTRKIYSIEQYSGKEVYVGIQCVTDNGFCLMLDDIEISSTVGFPGKQEMENLSIYPVPASDRLFVEGVGNTSSEIRFRITDLFGKPAGEWLIYMHDLRAGLDVSFLPDGLYIISVEDGQTVRTGKVMIDR